MEQNENQVDHKEDDTCNGVAALNLGNSYSGYAFSTDSDFKMDSPRISINSTWECSGRPLLGKRTSTCILFSSDETFLSFGYEAEEMYATYNDDNKDKCYFFRHFQKEILSIQSVSKKIKDVKGKELLATTVFTQFIKALVEKCTTQNISTKDKKIRWIITVPADLTYIIENFMEKCAEKAGIQTKQLRLVTEADAAFVFSKEFLKSDRFSELEENKEYMIVNLEGYLADITVVTGVRGKIKEKYREQRNGSLRIISSEYEELETALKETMGEDGIKILRKDPFSFFEIKRGFEEMQLLAFYGKQMFVQINASTKTNLEDVLDKHSLIEVNKKGMFVSEEIFKGILQRAIDKVILQIKKVFKAYREANKISFIVMTGDFYECCLVKQVVEDTFPQKRIIFSAAQEEAVMKGAVLFGRQPYEHTKELLRAYDKPADQRGFVIVINFEFPNAKNKRTGSEKDVDKIKVFFDKYNYEVECCSDMTSTELESKLTNVKNTVLTTKSNEYHSFICVIMSHGDQTGIETSDGIIQVDELVSIFKNDTAKSFIGKPKIFMIQSCRGGDEQGLYTYENPGRQLHADDNTVLRVPTDADIITIYATTPGCKAKRTTKSTTWVGAWFIHAFITAAEMYPHNHLLEILTAVNYEIATNSEYEFVGKDRRIKGQMSISEVTLTKLFYL